MKKVGNNSKTSRGGAREGAGRPKGQTKKKVSISVDSEIWEKALLKSGAKGSKLVSSLLADYVER